MATTQSIDEYGCLRDSRYPRVVFGRPHPVREADQEFRPVASVNGLSAWGYMITCTRCGAQSTSTITSSVAYEDAPGHFAHRHVCQPHKYDREHRHSIKFRGPETEWETVELKYQCEGHVFWCSHWHLIDALRDAGKVRFEYGGPETYGHISVYVIPTD